MANLLLGMVQFITENGLAQGDGIDVFRDYSPPSPDNVIVLREYSGVQSLVSEVSNRSVQVMVRNVDPVDARDKAWDLYKLFDVPHDRILNFTPERWAVVTAKQPPFKIGEDENGRILFVFNLSIITYRD